MPKVERQYKNRVITVATHNIYDTDEATQELLDIIDTYGGTNPFPRFVVVEGYYYSCTTKIPLENLRDFDEDIIKWRQNHKQ